MASGRVVALKRIMVNNPPDLKLAKQEVAIMVSRPIIVDCTEWTSIVYPHVEISPSL